MSIRILAQYGLLGVMLVGPCSAVTDSRLIDAIKDLDAKGINRLVNQHVDVNAALPDGATPLAWAVYLDQTDTVDLLLKAGAKVNTADEYGETPVTLACTTGNSAVLEKLLKAGADAKVARWNGETALMIAARSGNVQSVKLLLDHGAPVNQVEEAKGQNALMWAAAEGHAEVVDLLLKSGADPKIVSKKGYTPLVFAAEKGSAKTVALLLDAGLDPSYVLPNGTSVLEIAAIGKKNQVAENLLNKGAKVDQADRTGMTPLHVAAQSGNLDLVKKLLAKNANPNVQTAKTGGAGRGNGGGGGFRAPAGEQTPLLLAARANHEDVMRALVAAGADPKLKAQDGTTVLMNAASSGHIEVVKYAYELYPDVNAATTRKSTVMHAAVTGSMQTSTQAEICKVVQFLADKGADVDPLDATGRTPIAIANVLPIDKAVELMTKLIVDSGKTPKISGDR